MSHITLLPSTLGGLLLGAASSLLFLFNGHPCGVSGIVGDLSVAANGDRSWRLAFVAGLLAGGSAADGERWRALVGFCSSSTAAEDE